MKRLVSLVLALLLCGCAIAEGNWYIEEGQALALRMQALAADEAYMALMLTGDEEMRALRESFVQADLSEPEHAWFMALPDGDGMAVILERLSLMGGSEADMSAISGLSDVGREELIKRLPAAASSILTANAGVSWIALANMINVGEAKAEPEDFAPGFLLLEYSGDFDALVTFTRPLPGYASASAALAPANSLDQVQPLLEVARKLGLPLALEEMDIE